ncbi:MAG TPA: MBL fold metallo-hydrolase, partial [Arenibacter sp.]|nr:MBL fold metallo-hydrolase [Arenibacter sp.]
DHTGYLPKLVKEGFRGKIIGTPPTLAITRIILLDSAKIQEEEAERANAEVYSKHHIALPLYTLEEAKKAIDIFQSNEKDKWTVLSKNIRFKFGYNGHIIGSTFIELEVFGKIFVFSGDVGRIKDPILAAPDRPIWADYLFVESTYGNKLHPEEDVEGILVELVHKAINERGNLIIPSFAVERLQSLMYTLWQLYKKNKIPNIPIFIDSPMGNNVLSVFETFSEWHKLSIKEYRQMCDHFEIITSYADTWKTIDDPRPKIVIAGSGMVTGGRVLTYLRQLIDKASTSVLLVGYQAEGTRGRQLYEGAHEIKLFGKYYPVKANIRHLESLSAHADQNELLDWMKSIKNVPETVFLIHGEPLALDAFRVKIEFAQGWRVHIPKLNEIREFVL